MAEDRKKRRWKKMRRKQKRKREGKREGKVVHKEGGRMMNSFLLENVV